MRKKTWLFLLLAMTLLLFALPAYAAQEPVTYIERSWDSAKGVVVETEKVITDYTEIVGSSGNVTYQNAGWYVVKGKQTISGYLLFRKGANLILTDGSSLTVSGYVFYTGRKMVIYGQKEDSGVLSATSDSEYRPGVGVSGGNVIIHGGTISAFSKEYGAAIGSEGGHIDDSITVTIYGGKITAECDRRAFSAAIGSGADTKNATVKIYGGNISATAGQYYGDDIGLGGSSTGKAETTIGGYSTHVILGRNKIGGYQSAATHPNNNGTIMHTAHTALVAKGMYCSMCSGSATVANAVVTLSNDNSVRYNGKAQYPQVSVNLTAEVSGDTHSFPLTAGKDYTVVCLKDGVAVEPVDAGTYTVKIAGAGKYAGTSCETNITFTITPVDIGNAAPSEFKALTYTGLPQTPEAAVTVTTPDGDITVPGAWSPVTNVGETTTFEPSSANFVGTIEREAGMNRAAPAAADFVLTPPENLVYNGTAKAASVGINSGVQGMGEITAINYSPETPLEAGSYEVRIDVDEGGNYEAATGLKVGSFTIAQSQTSMTAKTDKREYTYGEYVIVTASPAATGVSAFGLRTRLAAPAPGMVSLWHGEPQLTEGQTPTDGVAEFELNTVEHGFTPGSYTLTAKYTASGNMAAQTADVTFTVAYAETTEATDAEVSGTQENGWHTGDTTLTADGGTTVSMSNGAGAVWTPSLTLPTEEGEHTYTYYVKLPDGTIAEKSVTVSKDTIAPAVPSVGHRADPTTAQVTFDVIETGSGVKEYALTQTSGKGEVTITDLGNGEFDLSGLTPGETYTFLFTVTDNAGNTTTVEITLTAALMPVLPQTGDNSSMGLWLMLMALAGAGMLALRRRAQNG